MSKYLIIGVVGFFVSTLAFLSCLLPLSAVVLGVGIYGIVQHYRYY